MFQESRTYRLEKLQRPGAGTTGLLAQPMSRDAHHKACGLKKFVGFNFGFITGSEDCQWLLPLPIRNDANSRMLDPLPVLYYIIDYLSAVTLY